ncbi:MAG: MBOAT family protein, partial [Butyricicoccus sp.]
MSLYSLTFLFRFLPVFLAVYYIAPAKWRKYVLILGSLLFVGFTDRLAVPVVVGAVLANWALGRLMPRAPRPLLLTGVACDLGLLLAARYCGLSLPGASFFCFSLLSYLADVYRYAAPAASLSDLGAYACMFPKLLSGPIARYPALAEEIDTPKCTCARLEDGLSLLILGLSYKVLLADPLGGLWSLAGKIGYESLSTPMAWLSALGFSLQLYFDFQGYSLMAIGLGRMLGF